jgi:hypothetical protein
MFALKELLLSLLNLTPVLNFSDDQSKLSINVCRAIAHILSEQIKTNKNNTCWIGRLGAEAMKKNSIGLSGVRDLGTKKKHKKNVRLKPLIKIRIFLFWPYQDCIHTCFCEIIFSFLCFPSSQPKEKITSTVERK